MNKKINYIIREVPPEQCDFSFYFEDDGLTELGGDYYNNLFIITFDRFSKGFNYEEYKRIQTLAEAIIDNFYDIEEGYTYHYNSYKEVMEYHNIPYNSHKCHKLKEWAKNADTNKTEDIAEFLTITTGKKWTTDSATGYCQGDYVEMVYCPEHYKDGVKPYGEIWLGAGKEFCVIYLDENGEEDYTVWGYIIADCQAWKDEDYKRLVCEWACIPEEKTQLEMIDGYKTYTKYNYRIS